MSLRPLKLPSNLTPVAQRILHSLNTCTSPFHLSNLHSQIFDNNLHHNTTLTSSFINTCLSLHHLSPAISLFSRLLPNPHIFVCNTLLRALLHFPESPFPPLLLLSHMHKSSIAPNHYTFPLVIKSLSDIQHGWMIHGYALKVGLCDNDIYVQNSLIKLYADCGDITAAERVFYEMPMREVVSWSSMIMAYKNCSRPSEALVAFERMQFAGVAPNRVTMVNALDACAANGMIEMGVWIHEYVRSSGWETDVVLGTALIDMYGKCGRIDTGLSVFSSMPKKNVFSWNTLITGFGLAKKGEEALKWFYKMEEEGVRPDAVTLIGVLGACSHSKLVEIGKKIFHSLLNGQYGFYPGIKHYGCMIDLLARSGSLNEALQLIDTMPFVPNVVIWGSLFDGCHSRGDLQFGELAVKKLVELEPTNVAHYVLLSNLYAETGRWREAEEVRRLLKEKRLNKDAGWSTSGYEIANFVEY